MLIMKQKIENKRNLFKKYSVYWASAHSDVNHENEQQQP